MQAQGLERWGTLTGFTRTLNEGHGRVQRMVQTEVLALVEHAAGGQSVTHVPNGRENMLVSLRNAVKPVSNLPCME